MKRVYDGIEDHKLSEVPGVLWVTRLTLETLRVSMGGEPRLVVVEVKPMHSAIYGIEGPEVLISREWGAAVEAGRWPEQVRPYTSNRRHTLRKVTTTTP